MDALCNLNLDDEDTDNDEMVLSVENEVNEEMNLDENFLISEEDDITLGIMDDTKSEHPTLNERVGEHADIALGITDNTKSEHPTSKEHVGEHAGFTKREWKGMIVTIKKIMSTPTKTPSRPEFDFNLNEEFAMRNSNTLKKYGYNMSRAIAGNERTTMWYGLEFRSPDKLRELMSHHAYWNRLDKNMRE
eukprot:12618821-Ditylum_brightwellii.AAC.1